MNLTAKMAKLLKSKLFLVVAGVIAAATSVKIGLGRLGRNHNDMWE
jgi:hypothetical protein